MNGKLFTFLRTLVFSSLVVTSCSPAPDAATRARIDELQKKVEAQSVEIAKLSASARAEKELSGRNMALLDPSEKGYAYCKTEKGGLFFISVDGVEPYLDGQKIRLAIGNPMNMTYAGFKLRVLYGRRPPPKPTLDPGNPSAAQVYQNWEQDGEAMAKTLRTKEVVFTEKLEAGAWSKISFVLPDTKPEDVGFLGAIIFTDQIFLRIEN